METPPFGMSLLYCINYAEVNSPHIRGHFRVIMNLFMVTFYLNPAYLMLHSKKVEDTEGV